jgi:hypothetical protein
VAHVGALALIPLSLAQAIIASGFVVLAVLAERMFGFGLGRPQWGGIALVASGLGCLGATAPLDAQQTRYSLLAIAVFQTLLLLFGLLLVVVTHTAAVAEQGPLEDDAARDDEHPRTGGAPQAPVTAHATSRHPHRMAGILIGNAAGIASPSRRHAAANAPATPDPFHRGRCRTRSYRTGPGKIVRQGRRLLLSKSTSSEGAGMN